MSKGFCQGQCSALQAPPPAGAGAGGLRARRTVLHGGCLVDGARGLESCKH